MQKKKIVNVGLIGCGTVGTGVVDMLRRGLGKRGTVEVRLKTIVDKNEKIPHYSGIQYSSDINAILEDPSIEIGIELIGGYEPAFSIQKRILESGRHLVTANKAVISKYGPELFQLAYSKGLFIGFEASVCGSIPIIHVLSQSMPNKIKSILGIVNGSTNYILSRMDMQEYSTALAEAQQKGFAEKDPRFDVEGLDSAQKLAILTQIVFHRFVLSDEVYTEGITHIHKTDIDYAKELGYVIKLLAIARSGNKLELRVHPTMIPQRHFLASVRDEFNAVYIDGEATAPQMYLGKGAGQMPTANSVVSDLVNIATGVMYSPPRYSNQNSVLLKREDVRTEYYLRFTVRDKPGVLAKISQILGDHKISIASVVQKGSGFTVPLVLITHLTREGALMEALPKIEKLGVVHGKPVVIRVMNL